MYTNTYKHVPTNKQLGCPVIKRIMSLKQKQRVQKNLQVDMNTNFYSWSKS